MADLRIDKLHDRTPIKLPISVLPDLNDALADYANIYAKAYGQTDPVIELIPKMLQTILIATGSLSACVQRGRLETLDGRFPKPFPIRHWDPSHHSVRADGGEDD